MVRMDDSDLDWSISTTDAILKAFSNAQIPLTAEVWITQGIPQTSIDYVLQWRGLPYIEIAQGMYGDIVTGPPTGGRPGSNTWTQAQWETYIQTELNEFPRAGVTPKTFFCNMDAAITNNGLNAMYAKGFHTFDCPAPVPTAQRRTLNPFVTYSNDWEESFALNEGSGTLAGIRASADSMIASKGYANFVFHVWSDVSAANDIIPHLVTLRNEGYVFATVDEYYNYLNEPVCSILGDASPCDIITRAELGTIISNWISGSVTRAQLGTAIQSWANG
jgi:hypothetical protein